MGPGGEPVSRPARPQGVDDRLPRVGLATSAIGPEPSVACLAMLAGLTRWGWRVQHFRTRACLTAKEAVGQVTGMPGRHLDAWLMPPEVCRGLLARAGSSAELSVVEGTFGQVLACSTTLCEHPGELRPVAEALDLPILAVVSCRGSDGEGFHLPAIPDGADAVLLDEVPDPSRTLSGLVRLVELASGLPVVGAVEAMPEIRKALER